MLNEQQKKLLENKLYEIVKKHLNEWEEADKSTKRKEKTKREKENTILRQLDNPSVNKAAIAYMTYGSKTDKEKAADRSIFYKKKNHEKNDNGSEYKFTNSELNKIASALDL